MESHFHVGKSCLPDGKSKLKQTELGEGVDRGGKEGGREGRRKERENPESIISFGCLCLNLLETSFVQ